MPFFALQLIFWKQQKTALVHLQANAMHFQLNQSGPFDAVFARMSRVPLSPVPTHMCSSPTSSYPTKPLVHSFVENPFAEAPIHPFSEAPSFVETPTLQRSLYFWLTSDRLDVQTEEMNPIEFTGQKELFHTLRAAKDIFYMPAPLAGPPPQQIPTPSQKRLFTLLGPILGRK